MPVSTLSGVLTREAKAALAEELIALSLCLFWCAPKPGTRHLS